MATKRSAGILLPIFSLDSPYGIGTLGREAYDFVDMLSRAKQRYWQILPIGPTGYGDSPYQSFSSYAGNPYFIDLRILEEEGLLLGEEYKGLEWGDDPSTVNYGKLYENRFRVLRIAFERFKLYYPNEYYHFCFQQGWWLDDYSLYMAVKASRQMKSMTEWGDKLRNPNPVYLDEIKNNLSDEISFYKFIQFKFFSQWHKLKNYANQKGVEIIGDLPIYVSLDSADMWSNKELFELDDDSMPTLVAGVPPDGFTDEGQLWGNPLYNWDYHRATGYRWWINRISYMLSIYDLVRIDHFRGFDSYYAIPAQSLDARGGVWLEGPKMELFDSLMSYLKESHKDISIIAEDLGFLTPSVYELLRQSGFPGMKVLQFAFGGDSTNDYLPHNYTENCVVYTGTHDNTTTSDWFDTATEEVKQHASSYLMLNQAEGPVWGLIRGAMSSVAATCIIPMSDYLELDGHARINTPSTPSGNWCFRLSKDWFSLDLEQRIAQITALYGRDNSR